MVHIKGELTLINMYIAKKKRKKKIKIKRHYTYMYKDINNNSMCLFIILSTVDV
jgi:hypothetical protein